MSQMDYESEEWRVVVVLGGSEQEFRFTDRDTIWPETAARAAADALRVISTYVRVSRRRTAGTDWAQVLEYSDEARTEPTDVPRP